MTTKWLWVQSQPYFLHFVLILINCLDLTKKNNLNGEKYNKDWPYLWAHQKLLITVYFHFYVRSSEQQEAVPQFHYVKTNVTGQLCWSLKTIELGRKSWNVYFASLLNWLNIMLFLSKVHLSTVIKLASKFCPFFRTRALNLSKQTYQATGRY